MTSEQYNAREQLIYQWSQEKLIKIMVALPGHSNYSARADRTNLFYVNDVYITCADVNHEYPSEQLVAQLTFAIASLQPNLEARK